MIFDPEPSDSDRYPGLGAAGEAMLRFLREHPAAPIYRNRSGHRLRPEEIPALRRYGEWLASAAVDPRAEPMPAWLGRRLQRMLREVPAYRSYGAPPVRLADLPLIRRGDLALDIARFVPDSQPIDRLINFRTTGTTGQPLLVASHPQVAARYLAHHERALARFGVRLASTAGDVAVLLLGWQRRCFTYVSVVPQRGEAGLAKINLHENDWRDPADRGAYLDALAPEVITGDPLSFAVLLDLSFRHRPRALLSTSMALSVGLRTQLEQRFDCPVLDIYSLNEAGPIAVHDPRLDAHVLLQPHMAIEILDDQGQPLPLGQRGEICLSGGFNDCLPLLRYACGDHAALEQRGGEWVLAGLAGRKPVRFRCPDGRWLNNIDLTHALKHLPIAQYTVLQRSDGSLACRIHGPTAAALSEVEASLRTLFGPAAQITVEHDPTVCDKALQYRSELVDEEAGG